MPELVFPQKKPKIVKPVEFLIGKGFIWIVFFYFLLFLNEEFVDRWGVTAVLIGALIICGLILLAPLLMIQWAKSDRVQNRRVPTLHIEVDRVVFHGRNRSKLIKFDEIKRVTVNRKSDGEIKSIVLVKGAFNMLNCQNFADMPGLYEALKKQLPVSVNWLEPKSLQRPLKIPHIIILFAVSGWLFSWLLNLDFFSAVNFGLYLILGIWFTYALLQQSQKASRGAKLALILGATLILGIWLFAMGDIPQVINHPCGLVHRWQSGCLKMYPESEDLLFLPDNQLARLSGRSIVIEPVDGNRFISLFRATRLLNDDYVFNYALSADGRTAIANMGRHGFTVWNVPEESVILQNTPISFDVAISPDGQLIGPSGYASNVAVWDVTTWQPVFTLESENRVETALGQTLLAVGLDQAVHFFEVRSGEETAVFSIDWTDEKDSVGVISFSNDEQLLALVTNQSILSILRHDGTEWQEIHRVQLEPSWRVGDGLTFSTDNTLLAVAQENYGISENRGQILIFSLADMQLRQTLDLGTGQGNFDSVRLIDFSADKSMLAVSGFHEGAIFKLAVGQ